MWSFSALLRTSKRLARSGLSGLASYKGFCSDQGVFFYPGPAASLFQVYGAIEYFSGTAWVTRCLRMGGIPTAALDLSYEQTVPGRFNVMDLATPAGMASPSLDSFLALVP